jgi:hypothetical protein
MTLRQFPLAVRLLLQRCGMALPMATLWLALASVAAAFSFHARDTERQSQLQTLQALRHQLAAGPARPATPAVAPDQLRYDAFRGRLVDHAQEAAALSALFDTARADGLALREGHYKYQRDEAGQYLALRIELPLKGSYAALRGFVRDALIAQPALSLREFHLKRDNVGDAALTAKLLFVLYERSDTQAAPAAGGQP